MISLNLYVFRHQKTDFQEATLKHWENALTLARMHRWMRSDFLRNWGAISPDGRRPEGGIAPQFRRKRTAFTDASEPESTHSHCYIEKIWCTIVKHFSTANLDLFWLAKPYTQGYIHMGLSWWVESIGSLYQFFWYDFFKKPPEPSLIRAEPNPSRA